MNQAGLLLCITAAVIFLCSAVWVWHTRRDMRRIMQHMNQMLEEACEGHFQEQVYDESMLSSVETKLAHYLAATQAAARQVTEEKEQVKQLIADISHQTKTPVANLLLYAQLLEEQELPPDARTFVQEINRQAQKLHFLIASLVKASRLQIGMLVLHPKRERLIPLVEEVLAQITPKAEEKQQCLEWAPQDLYACFDRKWTVEALMNLVDNAVKYTPCGGTVRLALLDVGLFVRVEIQDTGIGIPEEETAKIFQRFYRGESVAAVEGVGIGLYLARQIITGEDGYIKVSSRVGEGTSFYVYLPVGEV